MNVAEVSVYWFWPVLAFLLAGLWLWTMLRLRRATSGARSLVSGSVYGSVEAEDALKAAYALQEAGDAWGSEEVAHCVGLSAAMAEDVAGALVTFGWAEELHSCSSS